MTPKFHGNIQSDYIQVRDKTLGYVGNQHRCLDCRKDVEPYITNGGAKVYFPRCEACREAKERS